MGITNPTVSIGIPVYNGENYLEQAIDSVLAQTYSDFEVVLADNASTDRTQAICESYAKKDARIRYLRSEENKGATWNFNRAFELARGKYFKWLAHDDTIDPDFLASCVVPLDEDPGVVVSYSRVRMIDGDGDLIEEYGISLNLNSDDAKERFRAIILEWHLCFEVFGLIRASALRNTPLLGSYGHADGVLLARLALQGRMAEVPQFLFFSRRHAEQSMAVYGRKGGGNDYHSYVAWFDPTKATRIVYPQWRILSEYYKSLWQYPLGWRDRLICHYYMLRWVRQNIRVLVKDVLVGLRLMFSKPRK